jgi:hypothetical protein
MVVWVLTAGIGIYLLAAGITAQRQAAGLRRPVGARPAGGGGEPGSGGPAGGGPADGERAGGGPGGGTALPPAGDRADPLASGSDGATVVGAAALASITAPGDAAAPGGGPAAEGSPLLEFVHPLLALTGLTFWIFFVMTDDRLFAWIAFGVVVATVLAGLSWAVLSRRATRQDGSDPAAFPAHLLVIHGLAAACTVTLVVISAITAAHA